MNTAMPVHAAGYGFSGFIIGAVAFVIVSITGLKLVPAYIQNAQINRYSGDRA